MLSGVTLTAGGPLTAVAALFAYGEQGGWWDPSDFSTMYQDSAGTTPVTTVGQPVGRILDKSGRGNHRTQATAASRPTLRQDASGYYYLEYDGVDDSMATGSINFTATNKMTLWAGVHHAAAGTQVVLELGPEAVAANPGSFYLSREAGDIGLRSVGTSVGTAYAALAVPSTAVESGSLAIDTDTVSLRINGAVAGTSALDQGTGNYGNYPLYIGRRHSGSTFPFNGREYQTIIRGAASSASQITQAERYVASKMGLSLA